MFHENTSPDVVRSAFKRLGYAIPNGDDGIWWRAIPLGWSEVERTLNERYSYLKQSPAVQNNGAPLPETEFRELTDDDPEYVGALNVFEESLNARDVLRMVGQPTGAALGTEGVEGPHEPVDDPTSFITETRIRVRSGQEAANYQLELSLDQKAVEQFIESNEVSESDMRLYTSTGYVFTIDTDNNPTAVGYAPSWPAAAGTAASFVTTLQNPLFPTGSVEICETESQSSE
jgi:hypothetical protein